MSLHAEFAPPFEPGRPPPYNSAFLRFLSGSGFAPLEAALRACGRRSPPLWDEMAYVLGRMGDTSGALTILLEVWRRGVGCCPAVASTSRLFPPPPLFPPWVRIRWPSVCVEGW